ncbi:hypothetical protein CYMTET_4938 [Cymbomonas tetramitiformis]|uniref:Reverse transcriptase domain-containing protein n=1 Tax=Cymbomonas tetramitiformis TaxID=36881 RepID=A0AAE0H077_9CHLO|nr:hypothetical protein CYMTET_4938 [Cymbomonas tetramitiformis]
MYQCSALPFAWNDAPKIFMKFMKVLVECLRSPTVATDQRPSTSMKIAYDDDTTMMGNTTTCWGATPQTGEPRRARVLPYIDDFSLLMGSEEEAYELRQRLERVLNRLGLQRNVKKGHWEPVYLGLEVDLKEGIFRIMQARPKIIHGKATDLLCEASRELCWVPAWKLAAFNGLCQFVYLGVPAAKLYLREQYFVRSGAGGRRELLDEVVHNVREEGARVTVVAPYWPGHSWFRELETIANEACGALAVTQPVPATGTLLEVYTPLDDDWYPGMVADISATGPQHIQYNDGNDEWLRLSEELTRLEQQQETEESDEVAPMQEQALQESPRSNYGPKAKKFKDICDSEGWEWLPASEVTQVAASEAAGITMTERIWLPAKHVRTVHDAAFTPEPEDGDQLGWLRACTYVVLAFISFGRPDTGTPLQQENVLTNEEGVTVVLTREKGRNHRLKKRQLSIWWGMERLRELLELWTRCRDEA